MSTDSQSPRRWGLAWFVLTVVAVGAALSLTLIFALATHSGGRPAAPSCADAQGNLRTLFAQHRSALAIDQITANALQNDLQALDQACSSAVVQAFRTDQLEPWLSHSTSSALSQGSTATGQ